MNTRVLKRLVAGRHRPRTRPLSLALLLMVCLSSVRADTTVTPSRVQVRMSGATVRSGPGEEFYSTGTLQDEGAVEVYRSSGKWLAIRPPADSFSWVAQDAIATSGGGTTGEVLREGAESWIGSPQIDPAELRWQVRLRRGERVRILGEEPVTLPSMAGPVPCYRIAPPSGEFRWVHRRHLLLDDGSPDSTIASATFEETIPADGLRLAAGAVAAPVEESPRWSAATGSRLEAWTETHLAFTRQVAQSPERWDLQSLEARLEELGRHIQNEAERAEWRALRDRLSRLQLLQQRVHRLTAVTGPVDAVEEPRAIGSGVRTSGYEEPDARIVDPELDRLGRFDGTGWLVPVRSSSSPAPPYALVDDEGNVLHFVSPAPGLNLRRYARQRVGIFGSEREHRRLRVPLITAQRVVDLGSG